MALRDHQIPSVAREFDLRGIAIRIRRQQTSPFDPVETACGGIEAKTLDVLGHGRQQRAHQARAESSVDDVNSVVEQGDRPRARSARWLDVGQHQPVLLYPEYGQTPF